MESEHAKMHRYEIMLIAFYISGLSSFEVEYDEKYTLVPRKTVKSTALVTKVFILLVKVLLQLLFLTWKFSWGSIVYTALNYVNCENWLRFIKKLFFSLLKY